MDDLMSKLREILGSEEGMQKVQNVANMLGIENEEASKGEAKGEAAGGFDLSALNGLLSAGGQQASNDTGAEKQTSNDGLDLGGLDLNTLLKIQQVM